MNDSVPEPIKLSERLCAGQTTGLAGPANLSPAIAKIWADGLKEVLEDRAIIEKFEARETLVDFLGPEDYRKFLETQYKENLAIAERLGLRK